MLDKELKEVDRKRFTYAPTKGRLEYKPLNILDTLNLIRHGTHKRNYQRFKNVIRLEKRKLIIAKPPSSKPVFYTPQTLEIRIKNPIRPILWKYQCRVSRKRTEVLPYYGFPSMASIVNTWFKMHFNTIVRIVMYSYILNVDGLNLECVSYCT